MKIVTFSSGLGNQLFQFAFVEYLKKQFPNNKIYCFYDDKKISYHNGLEVNKVFNISFPKRSIYSDLIANIIKIIRKFDKKTHISCSDKINGRNNLIYTNTIFFDGWWQDKKYFTKALNNLKFNITDLSIKNKDIIKKILNTNSVSIHVRRGDYLKPQFAKLYGNICTNSYYEKALSITNEKIVNPQFFVFSDDIDWVKKHIKINNAEYISWNHGKKSYIDMFLMSKCKSNIIANSSFSYWAAILSQNNLVVYPKKWFNHRTPDIFLEDWIGL